jgi:hypothetical protein
MKSYERGGIEAEAGALRWDKKLHFIPTKYEDWCSNGKRGGQHRI